MKPNFAVDLNIEQQTEEERQLDAALCENKIKKLLVFYKTYTFTSFFGSLFWVLIAVVLFIPLLKVNNTLIAALYDEAGVTSNGSINYYRYVFVLSNVSNSDIDRIFDMLADYLTSFNIKGILDVIGQIGYLYVFLVGIVNIKQALQELVDNIIYYNVNKRERQLRDNMFVAMEYEETNKPSILKLIFHIVFCILGGVVLYFAVVNPMINIITNSNLPQEFTPSILPIILVLLCGFVAICLSISKKWLKCKYSEAYSLFF